KSDPEAAKPADAHSKAHRLLDRTTPFDDSRHSRVDRRGPCPDSAYPHPASRDRWRDTSGIRLRYSLYETADAARMGFRRGPSPGWSWLDRCRRDKPNNQTSQGCEFVAVPCADG